jgi:SAM-dependent methyltransferase
VTDVWSERAEAYGESPEHRAGRDLDLLVEWAAGRTALDVATGGGHTARRLRDAGFEVVTLDPAPGMQADVLAPAEHIPFADASFDVVTCRIAPHHFGDIRAAVAEMARVTRDLVLIVDNVFLDERAEEAERVRDPTHVRCYSEEEWRRLLDDAGLVVENVRLLDTPVTLGPWLERAGCTGDDAARVRELLAHRIEDGRVTLTRIAIKARKRT